MTKDKRTYDVLVEVWDQPEPYFTFPRRFAGSRPARYKPWRIGPDDKKKPTHALVSTRQSLLAIFPDAIAIGSPVAKNKGYAAALAMTFCIPMSIVLIHLASSILSDGVNWLGCFFVIFFFCMWLTGGWFLRTWLFTPSDWPIVFNRRTRQVSYLPVLLPPFWKFWARPHPQFRTCSWDEVKVRSYKYMETNAGKSFHDSYSLDLLWGGENGDPRSLRDLVGIGYQGYFEDELIFMLWEHIRRYMEEGGPPIQPGESLRKPARGTPIVYPAEVIAAAGGPPLSGGEVAQLAASPG